MSIDDIRSEVIKRWADQPASKLCLEIVDYIAKTPRDRLDFMTYRTFLNILGKTTVDDDLLTALTILTSSKIAALDAHAMFVDENDNEHEVEPEELFDAINKGTFVHPDTGQLVEDFSSRIIPFYVPSNRISSS